MASVGCCPQDQRFSGPAARSLRTCVRVYVCVCVRVCVCLCVYVCMRVCVSERERERREDEFKTLLLSYLSLTRMLTSFAPIFHFPLTSTRTHTQHTHTH